MKLLLGMIGRARYFGRLFFSRIDNGIHDAFLVGQLFRERHGTCGSELAHDEGVSVDINIDCDAAIASKLAPTGRPG
jgi:hypothetical protein